MNLDQFLELFNPLPGNHYLQIATCEDEISKRLSSLVESVNGEFKLVLYNDEHLNFTEPFHAIPRDNDMLILKDVYAQHQNKDMLIQLAYRTLANAAHIIILEKKGIVNIKEIKEHLEKLEFRAPNEIDILDGYDLIMAKKMHMWGNGL